MRLLRDFAKDETGATAIEYGLLAALIGVGIISSLKSLGGGTNQFYGTWTNDYLNAVE